MDEIRFDFLTHLLRISLRHVDSYLENQRRRAVRDAQGYYFPYKKYTLKDYKDLQKQEAQQNPYADAVEPTIDRVYTV